MNHFAEVLFFDFCLVWFCWLVGVFFFDIFSDRILFDDLEF